MIMKRSILMMLTSIALVAAFAAAAGAHTLNAGPRQAQTPHPQCPIVVPEFPVAVAPGQPEVPLRSTVGIINALCDLTLNFVGCLFMPTSIVITCDTNGDGIAELMIPLRNVRAVNRNLVQAVLPALSPQLPGTPFPLACCGGTASLTLSRTVSAGDNNVFGEFTQTMNCVIDLGVRAPVVISASPASGDCAVPQDLLISGSCFVLADGSPNVTSVFAVERGNPANVIPASRFVILNPNLLDALFDFEAESAGKTFFIFASGPNGTSRNLMALPEGAPPGCPLGNEQGVQVTFTCSAAGTVEAPAANSPIISSCKLERSSSGAFSLVLDSRGIEEGSTITVGGKRPKSVKLREQADRPGVFTRAVLKGKFCAGLPGEILVTAPDGKTFQPFACGLRCE
jgi:hypothetical protein